jgi:hypothetical protein
MVALNALIACWVEQIRKEVPGAVPRAYADDISGTVTASSKKRLREQVKKVHAVTKRYEEATGGEISTGKCFTFGSEEVNGLIPDVATHLDSIRLVGGSLTTEERGCPHTDLENKRLEKWKTTVRRIRTLPVSWFSRVKMMKATSSQAHWGQGTHTLPNVPTELMKMRTEILKAAWNMDKYSTSPGISLTILLPVTIDPHFMYIYQGLATVRRAMQDPIIGDKVRRRFGEDPMRENNGPVARLKQVAEIPGMRPHVEKLLQEGGFCVDEWLHDIRETWRMRHWAATAAARPAYAGIEEGVNRGKTCAYLKELMVQADKLQAGIDADEEETPLSEEDPRAKQGVLRRLMAGGLYTSDRMVRHAGGEGAWCTCGEQETIEHVSWHCVKQEAKRRPAMAALTRAGLVVNTLPPCFRYATIVPSSMAIGKELVMQVQRALVCVWQDRIIAWKRQEEQGAAEQGGGGGGGPSKGKGTQAKGSKGEAGGKGGGGGGGPKKGKGTHAKGSNAEDGGKSSGSDRGPLLAPKADTPGTRAEKQILRRPASAKKVPEKVRDYDEFQEEGSANKLAEKVEDKNEFEKEGSAKQLAEKVEDKNEFEKDEEERPLRDIEENGHLIRLVPPEFGMGIYCAKCGKSFTASKQRRRITRTPCMRANINKAEHLTKPGFWRSKVRIASDDIVEKYNKGGHHLDWNGKLGQVPFQEEEGLIRCKTCEKAWSFKDLRSNLPRTKCSNNPQDAQKESKRSKEGIAMLKARNTCTHDPLWDDHYMRWRCARCGAGGGRGYGSRFEAAMKKPCAGEGGPSSSTVNRKRKRGEG